MESRRRSGANGSRDGADAVGDAFQLVAQGLAQLQEALRQQKQEADRKVQEALQLHKQEAERKIQEAERRMREALRLQEERAATASREVERKLQEKDAAIRALQQRLEERLTAMEERTTVPEGSGGKGLKRLEGRVNEVEISLQRAVQKFMPRVEALLRQLEEPQSTRASLTTAASAREAPTTGGAAAGGGEEPPSSTSNLSPSRTGHQGAAAVEEERARRRLELRIREVQLRVEEAQTSPSPLGEQLCDAADYGRLRDVRRLTDSGADVNYTDSIGYTPLINAAMKESVEVVSLLLQRGADPNAVNSSGDSALHFAAMRDRSGRCVELLVRAGADVDARDGCGMTPLHRATHQNNKESVRALLAAGARRDLKPWDGRFKHKSPLEIARFSRIKDILRL